MLNRLPMLQKLLVTLLPVVMLVLIGIILFVQLVVRDTATEDAIAAARQMALAEGERITARLTSELEGVKALASAAHTRERIALGERRDYFNHLLSAYLKDRPELIGVWMVWEPDAFDGRDADYRETEAHDASGRFIPYWYRDGAGVGLEASTAYATPGEGDYYLLPRRDGKNRVLDPYLYPVAGVERLITTISVPILEQGRVVGVVGVDMKVDDFQTAISAIRHHQGVAALFTQSGTIVAHPDASRLGKSAAETEADFVGDQLKTFIAAIKGAEPFLTRIDSRQLKGEALILSEPVSLADTEQSWSIALALPVKQVLAHVNTMMLWVMLAGAVGIVVLGVLILILSRGIARPLRGVVTALEDIASGEGDLTRRLRVEGRDEVAQLATAFNAFVGKIQDLLRQVSAATAQLASAAEELSLTSGETREQVGRQHAEADQVATAMNEMTATVQEVARHANDAAQAARTVKGETDTGTEVVGGAIVSIEALAQEIEAAASVIQRLENDSDNIGKVLDVIRGIAEQTNLLALNAAIEAARAGEQGRGFAVVADEVRTLASRTQDSTKEIQAMIERLQEGANSAVRVMEQGRERSRETVSQATQAGDSLNTIASSMSQITDMNNQIASAAEEQTAVAVEIDRNVANIAQSVESTSRSSAQMASASEALAQLAAELQRLVGQFRL
ncbi:MAG: methyl-accepting chemotaxis protein [Chromatiaceae bacterium]|nr:methyl-accepting chemotaxis protein [Chromatiaceae bacterium]